MVTIVHKFITSFVAETLICNFRGALDHFEIVEREPMAQFVTSSAPGLCPSERHRF